MISQSHKSFKIPKGSQAYLKFHNGYEIPGIRNHKLHQQRAGPVKVFDKLDCLLVDSNFFLS